MVVLWTGVEEVPDGWLLWACAGRLTCARGTVRTSGHEGIDVLREEVGPGEGQDSAV